MSIDPREIKVWFEPFSYADQPGNVFVRETVRGLSGVRDYERVFGPMKPEEAGPFIDQRKEIIIATTRPFGVEYAGEEFTPAPGSPRPESLLEQFLEKGKSK